MSFIDIIIDEDLTVASGDFIQDIGDNNNAKNLLNAHKGHYFRNPTIGVGIHSQLNAEFQLTERESIIRDEFKKDGFTVDHFTHFLDTDNNFGSEIRVSK